MADSALMNAAPCEAVVTGSCVMMEGESLFYAGPLKGSPDSAGKLVLLSSDDFEKFKAHVEKRRH